MKFANKVHVKGDINNIIDALGNRHVTSNPGVIGNHPRCGKSAFLSFADTRRLSTTTMNIPRPCHRVSSRNLHQSKANQLISHSYSWSKDGGHCAYLLQYLFLQRRFQGLKLNVAFYFRRKVSTQAHPRHVNESSPVLRALDWALQVTDADGMKKDRLAGKDALQERVREMNCSTFGRKKSAMGIGRFCKKVPQS
jgi:hypothetical protein